MPGTVRKMLALTLYYRSGILAWGKSYVPSLRFKCYLEEKRADDVEPEDF